MTSQPNIIHRAYELAQSGKCERVTDVRRALLEERFTIAEVSITLAGTALSRDLRRFCKEAQSLKAG